jgi:hypothetical protein
VLPGWDVPVLSAQLQVPDLLLYRDIANRNYAMLQINGTTTLSLRIIPI